MVAVLCLLLWSSAFMCLSALHFALPQPNDGTEELPQHPDYSPSPPMSAMPQPRMDGALEYTPAFRKATQEAVARGRNFEGGETGFVVGKTGGTVPVGPSAAEAFTSSSHNMKMPDAPWMFATLHTHPNRYGPKPSDEDIADAKKTGKPYYITSREGLFMVSPSDGKVTQIFSNRNWFENRERR